MKNTSLTGATVSVNASSICCNVEGYVVAEARVAGGRFLVRGHLTGADHAGLPRSVKVAEAISVSYIGETKLENAKRRFALACVKAAF